MAENVFLPEDVDVITRTDLGLSRHAASGVLHYTAGKFAKDVKETLETYAKHPRRSRVQGFPNK